MSETGTAAARYIMGHNDRERRRLALQASIQLPFTEHLFRRAGIATGMHVLDIGCGVGDVSLLAARLVGRTGSVTSVDFDEGALSVLRSRAASEGLLNISPLHRDVMTFEPDRKFDAVVGRHILIHTLDPLAVLKSAYRLLQPRGIAAFQEFDFGLLTPSYPACPLRDRAMPIFRDFFAAAVQPDMGRRLFSLLTQAGFDHPDCRGEFPVDGGPESPFHEWLAEALRSILPRAQAMNTPGAADIDIETFEQGLRAEAAAGTMLPGPPMFSCFARRP
ncbi:MAG: methyltransferase domain-containing protein [Acidobacteriota bacterium]|nr:methyltransferase domain-containing protein [Acidobacteriota bacterium]